MLVIRWELNSDKIHEVSRQVDIETLFLEKEDWELCWGYFFYY